MDEKRSFKKKKIQDALVVFEHGKVQPQAINLEEALIGNFINGLKEHVKIVFLKMIPEYFYKEEHQLIFKAIQELLENNDPVDSLTVITKLREIGTLEQIGGPYAVEVLSSKAIININADFYFRIVYQKYLMREMIRLSSECISKAYEDTTDCFDLLNKIRDELEALDTSIPDTRQKKSFHITSTLKGNLLNPSSHSSAIYLTYKTGWKRFDNRITINSNKIIGCAGGKGHGKTSFIACMIFNLLDQYPDIAIDWFSFEDSAEDMGLKYVSRNVFIKPKDLKRKSQAGEFNEEQTIKIDKALERFGEFDIEFTEDLMMSKDIINHFYGFCKKRKDKFNILILDNVLSCRDFEYHDDNKAMDNIYHNLQKCKQRTHGLIIAIHHFKKEQIKKENVKSGYRPSVEDLKGTEGLERIANQVLLFNNPSMYADLLTEYSGDQLEVLKKIFICDTGKNRDDKKNEQGLIHYYCEMDYDWFQEIDPEEKQEKPISSKRGEILI